MAEEQEVVKYDGRYYFTIAARFESVKGKEAFGARVRFGFGVCELAAETSDGTLVSFSVRLKRAFFEVEPEETSQLRMNLAVEWPQLSEPRSKVTVEETRQIRERREKQAGGRLSARLSKNPVDAGGEAQASTSHAEERNRVINRKSQPNDPEIILRNDEGPPYSWDIEPVKDDYLKKPFQLGPQDLHLVARATDKGSPNQPPSAIFKLGCRANDLDFPIDAVHVDGEKASLWQRVKNARKANKRKLAEAIFRRIAAMRLGLKRDSASQNWPNSKMILAQTEVELPHDEDS